MEVKSPVVLAALPELGIEGKKSHSSSVDDDEASKIRAHFSKKSAPAKQAKQAEAEPELELRPTTKKRRTAAAKSAAGSTKRSASAAAAPKIKAGGGGGKPTFRPPMGTGGAPKIPLKKQADDASAGSSAPPAAKTKAAAPKAKTKAKPEKAAAAADLPEDSNSKPDLPPPPVDVGPDPKRPPAEPVPGQPNGPSQVAKAPEMPADTPKTPAKSAGSGAAGQPSPPALPGSPEPAKGGTRLQPIRPPVNRQQAGQSTRPPMAGPQARPAATPSSLVPGKPIITRSPHQPQQTPGMPVQSLGGPMGGYGPRGGGPGMGGMRPGPPGRGPMGGPGGRPGPGGRRPGGPRPRPQTRRRTDLEALAESKIQVRKEQAEIPKAVNTDIYAADGESVKDLAAKLGIKANFVMNHLLSTGQRMTINQPLEMESIKAIAKHFGATATELTLEEEAVLDPEQDENLEDIEGRPPVVTIMGHVDHGKTSLLDKIRASNLAEREAGGITQAIGAYHVVKDDKRIVFIDTPGHEAFTKMRAQGASVTDVVVLVVAADDGVMPQTIEAIEHATEAKVPIIVAVNKIDIAEGKADAVKQQLSDRGLVSEEWGGDTIFCPVSAKTGEGIDSLLETINLVSEMRELRANPARAAIGVVIEAKLDRGKGPVATVLVQNGTLREGDTFVVGKVLGKVRAMMDDRGDRVQEAGPSSAVVVLGLEGLPEPGDQLSVLADTERARKTAARREEKARQQEMAKTARVSLEQFQEQLADGRARELPIIVKADFQGSATVLQDTLAKLTSEKVKVRVILSGVGAIKESDILLAITANAIVVGFNVRPERSAADLAEKEHVDVRLHTVIYELVDELKSALAGLLDPIRKETVLGRAKVGEVYHISNLGTVAGCVMEEGVAKSKSSARLLRDNAVIHTGSLASLRRFKDDVKEVREGQECGMRFERFNDIKQGDEIEVFKTVEIEQDINELIPV